MSLYNFLIFLLIGIFVGWLAGVIWKGRGFGLVWNLIIGVAGAFLGGFIFYLLGIHFQGYIGLIIAALAGALILLAIVNAIRRR
jgi:uncharacterized membrane protein YeaQ/YmgE (transglycosylase-associated protein family)